MLLIYCFASLGNPVLRLNCFAYLYLMEYNCHLQFIDFFIHIVQTILGYKYFLMSYINQVFYYLKHFENLKHFKNFKYLGHFWHPKSFNYFNSQFIYLIFYLLDSNFRFISLKVFLGHV